MDRDPLSSFEQNLRSELVAAARRQHEELPVARPMTRLALQGAAVLCLIAVISVTLLVVRPQAASAEVFEITRRNGEVVLDVVDLVDDPQSIIDQLSNELGLEAQVEAVPVPDDLVGAIIAVGSLGLLEPTIEESADMTVTQIRIPEEGAGPLIFEYGRKAMDGESYVATSPDTSCADFFGQPISEVQAALDEAAPNVRYELFNSGGSSETNVDPSVMPLGAVVVRTYFLDAETLLVEVSVDGPTDTPHPNCIAELVAQDN